MRFLAPHRCLCLCLAAVLQQQCLVSGLTTPGSTPSPSCKSTCKSTDTDTNGASHSQFRRHNNSSLDLFRFHSKRKKRWNWNPNVLRASKDNNNHDRELASNSSNNSSSNNSSSSSSSDSAIASPWKRRKQFAMGLVASIAATVGAAKAGWLDINIGIGAKAHYTDAMIAHDAVATVLTAVLAWTLGQSIAWGFENGKYDSNTGRKISHITSAPLFIVTWPFFSAAPGARFFAGLVVLPNIYRLYLAGTGDKAESTLANTISRTGDKKEAFGGPFIYVCLFQFFLLAFWRDSFPGVVAMTTMAAGDGMADIIGRRYGRNGTKWPKPFGDGQKSLVGTLAFAVFAFGLTLGVTSWLIATGALTSSLAFPEMARTILAISCICALVEVLPREFGDDNYTVPGSAAVLSWLWLR